MAENRAQENQNKINVTPEIIKQLTLENIGLFIPWFATQATICPISFEPMNKPTITNAGHTYDETSITGLRNDPNTGDPITHIFPNYYVKKIANLINDEKAIREIITAFMAENSTLIDDILKKLTASSNPKASSLSAPASAAPLSPDKNLRKAIISPQTARACYIFATIKPFFENETMHILRLSEQKITEYRLQKATMEFKLAGQVTTEYHETTHCLAFKTSDKNYIFGLGFKTENDSNYHLFIVSLAGKSYFSQQLEIKRDELICIKAIDKNTFVLGTKNQVALVCVSEKSKRFKLKIQRIFSTQDNSIIDIADIKNKHLLLLTGNAQSHQIILLSVDGKYRSRIELQNTLSKPIAINPMPDNLNEVYISYADGTHLHVDTNAPDNKPIKFKPLDLPPQATVEQVLHLNDNAIACHYAGQGGQSVVVIFGLSKNQGEIKELGRKESNSQIKLFIHKNTLLMVDAANRVVQYSIDELCNPSMVGGIFTR